MSRPEDTLADIPSRRIDDIAPSDATIMDGPPSPTRESDPSHRGQRPASSAESSARTMFGSEGASGQGREARHENEDDRTISGVADQNPDATISDAGARPDPDVERTLAGDDAPEDDRTLMEGNAAAANRDADATIVGDDFPEQPAAGSDDRTLVGDPTEEPLEADRTVLGDDEPRRPAVPFADATEAGEPPPAQSSTGAAPRPSPPESVPQHYELVEDFARGGMGKIWRANDLRIRREVAYKELLPNALRNPVVVERFLKEAQVTGQLEHPGIVPIYDLGWQSNGTPFYSMKLVRGSTFKKSIEACHELPRESSERRLAFVKLLQQFVAICNTMAYAHERHVLHRDLKPLNIMVGDFGETLVLDWGLARLMNDPAEPAASDVSATSVDPFDDGGTMALEGDAAGATGASTPAVAGGDATIVGDEGPEAAPAATPSVTRKAAEQRLASLDAGTQSGGTQGGGTQGGATQSGATASRRASVVTDFASAGSQTVMGAVMGTPAYMPPEQATGRLDELDARSDIYSLGAILYEILTNRAPIPKDKLPAMLKMVVEGKIAPPRSIDPSIPKPLEAVCIKALSKAKPQRYSTALSLAREVEAWLADEPVSAFLEPWHQRLGRWIRRHRTLVSTASAVVAFAFVGALAWAGYESRRVAGIEAEARGRLVEGLNAIEQRKLQQADTLLREASGRVASEPKLESLQAEIARHLESISRMQELERAARMARLRDEVRTDVVNADAARAREDLNEALRLLTAARVKLQQQPFLDDLLSDVQKRIESVSWQIADRAAVDAAGKTYQRFLAEVDQARFYGSFFQAGSIDEQRKAAQKHAMDALKLYRWDEAGAAFVPPPHLSEPQTRSVREGAFETLLILADTEMQMAGAAEDDQKIAAARKSLEWIERAKSLGIVSKILPLREAIAYDRTGDAEKRDEALSRASEIEPTTALDFYLLGQEERYDDRLDAALALYQKALQVDPQYFWALQNIGLCHLRKGRADAAVSAYTAAIAARPAEAICYLTRAIAYADLGQFEQALADLKKAEELKADPYELRLNRGGVLFAQESYLEAVAEFEAAAALPPDRSAPHRNLGAVYRLQADRKAQGGETAEAKRLFEKAISELTRAIELSPGDAIAYAIRADVELRLDDAEAALADFKRAATRERDGAKRAKSFLEIGRIHQRKGDMESAIAAYQQSLGSDASDPIVHRLMAEAYNALDRKDEAEAAWTKFLERGDPVGDVYRGRSLVRAGSGRYRDAMNDYTRALELEPSPNMLTRRGWAYLLQANKLALDDFSEAIALNPEDPDSYNGRGYARVMMGDHQGAVADAEEAVKKSKGVAAAGQGGWQNFYNASTIFAQAVDRVKKDSKPTSEEREALAAMYTTRSLQTLADAARAAGMKNQQLLLRTIQSDSALDPIRDRPEFQKVFAPKKSKSDSP